MTLHLAYSTAGASDFWDTNALSEHQLCFMRATFFPQQELGLAVALGLKSSSVG